MTDSYILYPLMITTAAAFLILDHCRFLLRCLVCILSSTTSRARPLYDQKQTARRVLSAMRRTHSKIQRPFFAGFSSADRLFHNQTRAHHAGAAAQTRVRAKIRMLCGLRSPAHRGGRRRTPHLQLKSAYKRIRPISSSMVLQWRRLAVCWPLALHILRHGLAHRASVLQHPESARIRSR